MKCSKKIVNKLPIFVLWDDARIHLSRTRFQPGIYFRLPKIKGFRQQKTLAVSRIIHYPALWHSLMNMRNLALHLANISVADIVLDFWKHFSHAESNYWVIPLIIYLSLFLWAFQYNSVMPIRLNLLNGASLSLFYFVDLPVFFLDNQLSICVEAVLKSVRNKTSPVCCSCSCGSVSKEGKV